MRIDGKNYAFIDEKGAIGGEAIIYMRSQVPGPDGTIGYMVEPGTEEWQAWETYFDQTEHDALGVVTDVFPKQRAMFRLHGQQRKPYMVPAALPWMFDAEYSMVPVKAKPKARMSKDMTPSEIDALTKAAKRNHRDPEFLDREAKRNWVSAMRRLAPTTHAEDAFITILKGRPDLVEAATKAEMKRYGMGWGEIRKVVEGLYWAQFDPTERPVEPDADERPASTLPEARNFTEAEAASMRRLAGIVEQKDAAE